MTADWRPPTLQTPRLVLRPLTEDDADAIFEYAGNPNVTLYTLFETHASRDDSLAFIRNIAFPQYAEEIPSPMGICLREVPDRVVGTLGCHWATRANKTIELGYAIAERYWGLGIIAEAGRALLDHVFATYDVVRVQAHCMAENAASARVMEKLGMTFEGCLRQAVFRRGRHWDMLMYSVLRNEWPRR